MEKQTAFGLIAIALITGMILGGHVATIQGEIRCHEAMKETLITNNLAWYDPVSGEFVVLKVQPMQHLVIPKEMMENDVLRGLD